MGQPAYQENVTMKLEACCACGLLFGLTEDFQRRRKQDHKLFTCPNGHSQHYTGKASTQQEVEKLQQQLAEQRQQNAKVWERVGELAQEAETLKKEKRKLKKRYEAGLCPCCNRTFVELQRHMKTKHPGFSDEHGAAEKPPAKRRGRPSKK